MLIGKRFFAAAAVILMLLAGVQAQLSVTLSSQSICAVTGSTVKIPCRFQNYFTQREWYRLQGSESEPRVLIRDPQYSGRVSVSTVTSDCELTVRNVRLSDSGVYYFRYKTLSTDWISTLSGVQLTVKDLEVRVSDWNSQKTLTCINTCPLSNNPTYIWYKNGKVYKNQGRRELDVDSGMAGSYSCAVRGHEELRSPAVCVFDEKRCWSVTYSTQTICSLTGSSVDIHSYYTYPNNQKVEKVFWFTKKQPGAEPVDVSEDEEYQGRVQYTQNSQNNCSLRISNLTERDTQTYRFRFYTDHPKGRYSGHPGVSLSVIDLKFSVSNSGNKLNCDSTCPLSNNPTYIWYKNGKVYENQDRRELDVNSGSAGSYSCAVRGHEELRSPAVCVFDEKRCWSVTYSTQTICSLTGSSVDIHSYYTFPNNQKVTKVFWFTKEQPGAEPVDVSDDEEYQGRVQYTQNSQNNCSLRISNLTERDAQTYRFRFYTDHPNGKYSGHPGVSLSVTDLKVTVSDLGSEQKKLNCDSTCILSNNPTYIWYKNGQRVSDCKSASCSVTAVSGAVSYCCAVEGHDSLLSPPVYSPINTTAVVLPSGDTVEGDSVTLSCSSDANPPVHTYYWFKQGAAADTLLTTGWSYSIGSISSQHSGLYYCTAHNPLGRHNSIAVQLDVLYSPINTTAVVLPSGDTVEGDSVTLSCSSDANPPVHTYYWFKQGAAADTLLTTGQNYSISRISSQHSGLYYCTAHNPLGWHNSTAVHLDVLYSPINTTAVVLPSGDTVEGDSVTLSCSSDANPPVHTYYWFKQGAAADTLLTTGRNYSIGSISSQHSGLYYCTAHNLLGRHNSIAVQLDVLYAPWNLSVTVIPSVSGDLITLLCTSDSNPVSSYSWYRKTDIDVTLILVNSTTVTLSSAADGLYYCSARNRIGWSNSSELMYTSENRAMKYAVPVAVTAAFVLSSVAVFLCRRKRASGFRNRSEKSSRTLSQNDSCPVYANNTPMTSDPRPTASSADQDNEVQYSSVYFKRSHTEDVPLYSTVQPPKALNQEEEVEYATVSLLKSRAVREDEIYSNLKPKE